MPVYQQEFVDVPTARGPAYRLGLHVYPDPGADSPVVLIWPALGAPARFYRPFAQALGEAGMGVVVAELRGTGTSTPGPTRADRYGYSELAGDVDTVLSALKPQLDGRRVHLLGHSLGGQVCAVHLATSGREDIAGLILVAVGLPYYRYYTSWSWPRRLAVLGVTQAVTAIATVNRVSPGWAFGGRTARGVIGDWGYSARHGHFPPIDGSPVDLGRLRTPVLAVSVPRDRLTPHSTLDALCSGFTNAAVSRVRLDGDLDHFSWVRSPAAVVAEVVRFVT